MHVVADPLAKVPAGHATHPAVVVLGTQYVPALQQSVRPAVEHWG